jgi:wyosine [tRNA(Phe)-imidazoG37] synthetase (radical SAM superfamily)
MKAMGKKLNPRNDFKSAAIYKILVKGKIDDSWSDSFSGMQITVKRSKRDVITSTLVGEIADQTALTSILNNLYEMHLTVIKVTMLSEIE